MPVHVVQPVGQDGGVVGDEAAADEEHGQGAGHAQAAHQPGHGGNQPFAGFFQRAAAFDEEEAEVVEFDDDGHQSVHEHGHADADGQQHQRAVGQRGLRGERAQGDDDDFGGEDEVSAHRAFDFVVFAFQFVGHGLRRVAGGGAVEEFVQQFFHAFKAEEEAAEHQQRGD